MTWEKYSTPWLYSVGKANYHHKEQICLFRIRKYRCQGALCIWSCLLEDCSFPFASLIAAAQLEWLCLQNTLFCYAVTYPENNGREKRIRISYVHFSYSITVSATEDTPPPLALWHACLAVWQGERTGIRNSGTSIHPQLPFYIIRLKFAICKSAIPRSRLKAVLRKGQIARNNVWKTFLCRAFVPISL